MTKRNHILVEAYSGELIEVMLKASMKHKEGTEEAYTETTTPISSVGYFIDADDVFVHLCNPENEEQIDESIRLDEIITIKRIDEADGYESILASTPTPNKGEYN